MLFPSHYPVEIFLLPNNALFSKGLVNFVGGVAFPAVNDFPQIFSFGKFEKHVHVIGHHHKRGKLVARAVEMF